MTPVSVGVVTSQMGIGPARGNSILSGEGAETVIQNGGTDTASLQPQLLCLHSQLRLGYTKLVLRNNK